MRPHHRLTDLFSFFICSLFNCAQKVHPKDIPCSLRTGCWSLQSWTCPQPTSASSACGDTVWNNKQRRLDNRRLAAVYIGEERLGNTTLTRFKELIVTQAEFTKSLSFSLSHPILSLLSVCNMWFVFASTFFKSFQTLNKGWDYYLVLFGSHVM